jgi:LysM repeat protein
MKNFVLALIVAVLIATQVFSPAAAAACGDTYTVVRGDYLSKIANTCGVTLTALINANPEIKNINIVYVGQVIRIKNDSTIPVTGGNYVVVKGDTLFKIAVRYGTTTAELLRLNPSITNASRIYVGQVIQVPGAGSGTGTTPIGTRRVTVSTTSARRGANVVVNVSGFPANASIDFRMGKDGSAPSVFVDGTTNSSGAASATLTIPTGAVVGDKWVVKVTTTDRAVGVELNSTLITIIN